MRRLLLHSKKKFFCPYSGNILIEYPKESAQSLQDWLIDHYHLSLLNQQPIPQTDVILATVLDESGRFPGNAISFSRVSHMLDDEPLVLEHLESIRQTMDIQLQYGITNNTLVSIEDIPRERNGLRCGCSCPGCGQPLIARLGEKKRKHFGHKSGSVCNVEYAQQTALHMLAKEIIEQERYFTFPSYNISLADINWDDSFHSQYNIPRSLEYRKAYTANCTSVTLEKRVSDFVPDVIVEVHRRTCLIEIAVTHFIDEAKQQKINEVGLPVVEVDLSSFIGQQITREIVRDALISQVANKKWIYNPLKEDAIDWATAEYNKLYASALEREENERQKWLKRSQEKAQKEKIREKKREETAFLLEDLFEPENYKHELQNLRSDDEFNAVLRGLHLYKELNGSIPFFLDIPITGEMVFACDRRIWQAALFDKFIYYRKMDENETVRIGMNKIQTCLREHMDFVPIDWKLASRATVEINGCRQKFTLFYDVVKQYLDYLHYIGFISRLSYGNATVARIKTLTPPNEENAKRLQDAIEHINQFAPDVDTQIDQILHPPYPSGYITYYGRPLPTAAFEVESAESIQQRIENEYSAGHTQALEYDFDSVEPFYDKYTRRWLKCKTCGAIKREDEMLSYGGRGSENKGICKDCR